MQEFRPGSFQILPPLVKNLIIINAIVFFAQYALEKAGVDMEGLFALHYFSSPYFHWWQFITYMFMHGNLDHIFFNMFALWMFGNVLENVWGPQRFLIFYLVCGVGAAFCQMGVLGYEFNLFQNDFHTFVQNPTLDQFALFIKHHNMDNIEEFKSFLNRWSQNPSEKGFANGAIEGISSYHSIAINEATVGASGAIFGLLFAFGYMFPNALILVFFFMPMKAKYFVALYALIELFMGVRNAAGDQIAHFAHIGGMIFGYILLKIWSKRFGNRYR